MPAKRNKGNLGGDKNVLYLDCGSDFMPFSFIFIFGIYRMAYMNRVNYIILKPYINKPLQNLVAYCHTNYCHSPVCWHYGGGQLTWLDTVSSCSYR